MTPLACANCCVAASHANWKPAADVTRGDGGLVAGEEVPALLGARTPVLVHVDGLLGRRHHRRLARVEADGHDVEVGADGLVEHLHAAHQAVEDLRAQHRALVVHERHDHRPLAEVVAEPHGRPVLVLERGIERQRLRRASDRSAPAAAAPASRSTAGPAPGGARAPRAAPRPTRRSAWRRPWRRAGGGRRSASSTSQRGAEVRPEPTNPGRPSSVRSIRPDGKAVHALR